MARESPQDRLEWFRKNKRNHTVEDWIEVAKLFDFEVRKATKEGYFLQHRVKRELTVTLVKPGSTVMPYLASLILRAIDLATVGSETPDDE